VLRFLSDLPEAKFEDLFQRLRVLETQMGVTQGQFSTRDQTMQNSSVLARSPYYQEWREEVQRVFMRIDQESVPSGSEKVAANRLILMIFPKNLPINADTVWAKWGQAGREIKLAPTSGDEQLLTLDVLIGTPHGITPAGKDILTPWLSKNPAPHSFWVLEAASDIQDRLGERELAASLTVLSFARLKPFREGFLERINAIQRDLSDADAAYAELRQLDVTHWCPLEIATSPKVREFTRNLFLSGNGSLVVSNAFVEWGAAEAFRRARPVVLLGYFGTRNKPKPFTSVVVFENQAKASPLPEVEDLAGSALDAQVLARYIWLAASRYPEYGRALCLCIAEHLRSAYAVGPADCPLWNLPQPLEMETLANFLGKWLA
jgi:hypothetical protein